MDQEATLSEEPIGGRLILRHASKRVSGTWGPDNWDGIYNGRDIGRILNARHGIPPDQPWMWTITRAPVDPAMWQDWLAAVQLTCGGRGGETEPPTGRYSVRNPS
jgi:hypothetical protein